MSFERHDIMYSIHNIGRVYDAISATHRKMTAIAKKQGSDVVPFDLNKALKAAKRRYDKHCGNTSKYQPHQGLQEMHRRLRQMGKA